MSALLDFITDNPVDNETLEVDLSPRFQGKKFKISIMDNKQFSDYQKAATKFHKGKKVEFDSGKLNTMAILNHTVDPNFKDAASIKKAGCVTPEQFLNRALKAGEIVDLAQQIFELSGFDQDMDEAVEEAKNS